jgi:hypothetical protein
VFVAISGGAHVDALTEDLALTVADAREATTSFRSGREAANEFRCSPAVMNLKGGS